MVRYLGLIIALVVIAVVAYVIDESVALPAPIHLLLYIVWIIAAILAVIFTIVAILYYTGVLK